MKQEEKNWRTRGKCAKQRKVGTIEEERPMKLNSTPHSNMDFMIK